MGFVILPESSNLMSFGAGSDLPQPTNGEYASFDDAHKVAVRLMEGTPNIKRRIAEIKAYLVAEVSVTAQTEAPAPAESTATATPVPLS